MNGTLITTASEVHTADISVLVEPAAEMVAGGAGDTVTVNIPEGYVVGTPDLVAWMNLCWLVEREEVSDV